MLRRAIILARHASACCENATGRLRDGFLRMGLVSFFMFWTPCALASPSISCYIRLSYLANKANNHLVFASSFSSRTATPSLGFTLAMTIDKIFEALASTPRRRILAYLSKTSLTAGEISDRFEMSKPAVSKHLKILENAGLVSSEREGQFIRYTLIAAPLSKTIDALMALRPAADVSVKDVSSVAQTKKPRASRAGSATH